GGGGGGGGERPGGRERGGRGGRRPGADQARRSPQPGPPRGHVGGPRQSGTVIVTRGFARKPRWGWSMGGVFINYRGADSDTAAALIDRELAARLGSERVFLDSRSIPAGADFADELLRRLRAGGGVGVGGGPRWRGRP